MSEPKRREEYDRNGRNGAPEPYNGHPFQYHKHSRTQHPFNEHTAHEESRRAKPRRRSEMRDPFADFFNMDSMFNNRPMGFGGHSSFFDSHDEFVRNFMRGHDDIFGGNGYFTSGMLLKVLYLR